MSSDQFQVSGWQAEGLRTLVHLEKKSEGGWGCCPWISLAIVQTAELELYKLSRNERIPQRRGFLTCRW